MCSRKRPRCSGIASWSPEQMGERRPIRTRRVRSLERLIELLRIAEEDEGAAAPDTASAFASDICPASSTNSTSTMPSLAAGAQSQGVPAATLKVLVARPACTSPFLVATVTRGSSSASVGSVTFWTGRTSTSPFAASSTSRSRLPITLWLFAVMPTRFPAASSRTIIRAPVYVFPAPGGPWMASVPASSCSTIRRAASSSDSPGPRSGAPSAWPIAGGRAEQQVARGARRRPGRRSRWRRPTRRAAGGRRVAPCRRRCSSAPGPRDARASSPAGTVELDGRARVVDDQVLRGHLPGAPLGIAARIGTAAGRRSPSAGRCRGPARRTDSASAGGRTSPSPSA